MMSQRKISVLLGFALLAGLGLFFPRVGEAKTIKLTCTATNTIQKFLRFLRPGDVLQVSGTCNENVVIQEQVENITIDGQGTATINGPNATRATIGIRGNGITITKLTITGGEDGVSVHRGGTATIAGNTIHNTGRSGINLAQAGNTRITNNTIENNPLDGIHVGFDSSARVGFFKFEGLDTIPVEVGPNTIQGNGRDGVRVTNSGAAQIIDNTIKNNVNDGVGVRRMSFALIASNTIDNNGQHGIHVGENSGVNLGEDTGTDLDELPNNTTPGFENVGFGIRCFINSYANGRLGTLNGVGGASDFSSASCVDSLIP